MQRHEQPDIVIGEIRLDGCPEGPVLEPLEEKNEITAAFFAAWETPLSPWGGFRRPSMLRVVSDDGRRVLERWVERLNENDRSLEIGDADMRDVRVVAEIKPIDAESQPDYDRDDCSEALVGVVFRVRDSRHYYQFGLEGKRRVVLYRRADDEWFLMASRDVEIPDSYLTLEVALDRDGARCACPDLGVNFFHTDTTFPAGRAGVRFCGAARMASLRVTQTDSQKADDDRGRGQRRKRLRKLGADIPDPKLVRVLDLSELRGKPVFKDFAEPGRYDMLIAADTIRALTVDGETLWECPIKAEGIIEFSSAFTGNGRLIYGFTGERRSSSRGDVSGGKYVSLLADEMFVVNGGTGEVLARRKLPEFDDNIARADFSCNTGDITGNGPFDIALREWVEGGGSGCNVWACDRDLNILWHRKVNGRYGHHGAVQFFDADKDGRDEILAGGTLYDADGNVIWAHDLEEELVRIYQAHHYDSVAFGDFTGDEALDPVAFLLGSSAGTYVVDGLTGRTRMVHRIGHAQGRCVGKLRADIPGQQVLNVCRWGNYGILTLFSGAGDRLWSIQPDFIGQGSCPVWWGDSETQLIWTNTSGPVQAFYDGYGRRVKELTELQRLWGNRMRRDVQTTVIRMGSDPAELLAMTVEGKLHAFGPQ